MKLSMWILAEWLKEYKPKALIKNGSRTLTGARLFTDGMHTDPSAVYIASMSDFVDVKNSQVLCVSGQDIILLETDDISEVFNSVMAAFDYHNAWSDDLKNSVRFGCDLQTLLERAYETFKSPLVIADPGFAVRAKAGMTADYADNLNLNLDSVIKNGTMLLNTIMELNRDTRLRKKLSDAYYYNSEQQGFPTLIKNIFRADTHIGWLVIITKEDPPSTYQRHMFEELGEITELWAALNPETSQLPSFDDIFPQILSGDFLSAALFNYFSLMQWHEEDEKCLYIIESGNTKNSFSQIRSRLDNYLHGSAIAVYENRPVIIIDTKLLSIAETERYLKDFLGQTDAYCIKSPVFVNYHKIPDYYRICREMLSLCGKKRGVIYFYKDLVPDYAAKLVKENSAADLAHPALNMLAEYDAQNGTQLYETLKEYLLCERNYVKTAARLYIHRNSLVYRIKRIEEITGLDLDEDYTRLHVLMSYFIRIRNS